MPFSNPRVRRPSLSARAVVAFFAAVLLVVLWVLTLRVIASDREQSWRSARNDAASFARAFAEHSARTIHAADQTVLFVKARVEEQGYSFELRRHMASGVILSRFFTGVHVVGADARVQLSSVEPFERVDLSDREHIRVHFGADSGQLFVGKPVLGRVSRKWSIQLTRRVSTADGSFGGVIVASADPQYFAEFYSDVALPAGSMVALVGDDGIVRARFTGEDRSVGQDVSAGELYRRARGQSAGFVTTASTVDGTERLVAFRHLSDYPLFVAVGIPVAAIDAQAAQRRNATLAFASGGSALVLLFSAWIVVLIGRIEASRRQAETANRMKSEFLANMSHELRTPLNGVLGFADLLQETAGDAESRGFAKSIAQSGQHLLALLNSLLDLAKIEAGRLPLEPRPEDLGELVASVAAAHQPAAAAKGLALAVDTGPLPVALCDRTRLTQVLNNLLHNAIKFTASGRVDVRASWTQGRLRVAVRDTGPGIDPALQARLFRKFEQGDGSLTRRHEGAGLGLALVRELVTLMDGTVAVRSTPGAGATFEIRVAAPAVDAPAVDAPSARVPDAVGADA